MTLYARHLLAAAILLSLDGGFSAAVAAQIEVRSDSMTMNEKTGEIRFEGQVKVTASEGELTCDRLTLLPVEGAVGQVRYGRAEGNVVVTRQGDALRADRAEVDVPAGRIELSGSPTLSRGPSRIRAVRITYTLADRAAVFAGPVEAVIVAPEGAGP